MIKLYYRFILFIGLFFPSDNQYLLEFMNENADWVYDYTEDGINVSVINNDSIPIIRLEKMMKNVDGLFNIILNVKNYNNVLTERTLTSIYIGEIADTTYGYQITKNFIRNY